MTKFVVMMMALIVLTGCLETSPQEVGKDEFDTNKIAYFKDRRTNICFAVASFSRLDTAGRQAGGLSHTAVPCSPEVEKLLR